MVLECHVFVFYDTGLFNDMPKLSLVLISAKKYATIKNMSEFIQE